MTQVENGNRAGNNDHYKTGREGVKGGRKFSWGEPDRKLKGPKGHLRQRGSQRQMGAPPAPWRASDAAERASDAAERASEAAERASEVGENSLEATERASKAADRITKLAGRALKAAVRALGEQNGNKNEENEENGKNSI